MTPPGSGGSATISESRSIPERFAHWARLTPEAVAVQDPGRSLSYRELDLLSDRLALRLLSLGLEREDRVGVVAQRSPETVLAALATIKAGGAYMPLDPESPPLRTRRQLRDAGARIAVSPSHLAGLLDGDGVAVVELDRDLSVGGRWGGHRHPALPEPAG